jgi:DNA repair photolyase
VIPGLTDHEMPAILEAAKDAGAIRASYIIVRLPYAVKDLFDTWLQRWEPGRRSKVLHRLRELRGGKLNSPEFGARMKGEGVFADQLRTMFKVSTRRLGLATPWPSLTTQHFAPPRGAQLDIFAGG